LFFQSLSVYLLIKQNLLLKAQLLARAGASPIPLAPAGQATRLSAGLAEATIRTGMLFPLLLPATGRLKDVMHSGKAPEAKIFTDFRGLHTGYPHLSPASASQTDRPRFSSGGLAKRGATATPAAMTRKTLETLLQPSAESRKPITVKDYKTQ
jgi:hypothetical protein